jgi:type I restriction enzyme, S subunit
MKPVEGWHIFYLDALVNVDLESLNEKTARDFAFYYLDISSVSEGKINLPPTEILFRDAPSRARTVVHRGDVLMSTVRPNLKAFAYFDHFDAAFVASTGFAVLTAKEGTDPRFILYAILSDSSSRQIEALVSGSNYPAITSGAVRRLQIPTPPPAEQTKIAEVLSTVDRAIEQTEALIAKQKRITTGMMQDLLTRGIDENGKLRSERTHRFKDSPLGRIPEEWDVRHLEGVADFVTSGSRGWAEYYAVDGAVFLRIGNLTRNHINLRLDDIIRVNPPPSSEGKRTSGSAGDLLISITADLGVIGVIPEGFEEAYVNQHIALVRLVPAKVDPRFIGWFLSGRRGQAQFEKLNESGAKAGLNLPTVRRLFVPVMNRPEQTLIAEILDSSTQQMSEHYLRLNKLRSLKAGLMQDLLSGRKRVTNLLDSKPTRENVYASQ